jgi:hypothetical protein
MRRRGDGQKLGDALDDAENANLGIAQRDKSGIEAFRAGASHVDEFPPVFDSSSARAAKVCRKQEAA